MTDITRIYIAHPLRGLDQEDGSNLVDNRAEVAEICRKIADMELEQTQARLLVPVSPIHCFSMLDDQDQEIVISFCLSLIDVCDVVWVFGRWWESEGVMREMRYAIKQGLRIRLYHDLEPSGTAFEEIGDDRELSAFLTDFIYKASSAAAMNGEKCTEDKLGGWVPEW